MKRTPRQDFFLRLARLLWHDIMDGIANQKNPWVQKELGRLLKLAKATVDDL